MIRAFNEDLAFDRFILEQLAADVIAPKDEPWRLAAMGFLTLGRAFDNNIHDQIDDRIDTVCRGLLGLTVACARCHDHKYDAIATADYYSLYGVFASSETPLELPLIERLDKLPECAEFEKKAAAKRAELGSSSTTSTQLLSETARQRVGDYLARAATFRARSARDGHILHVAGTRGSPAPDGGPLAAVSRAARHQDDPVFGPWHDLMRLAEADFPAEAAQSWPTGRQGPREPPRDRSTLWSRGPGHASLKTGPTCPASMAN